MSWLNASNKVRLLSTHMPTPSLNQGMNQESQKWSLITKLSELSNSSGPNMKKNHYTEFLQFNKVGNLSNQ